MNREKIRQTIYNASRSDRSAYPNYIHLLSLYSILEEIFTEHEEEIASKQQSLDYRYGLWWDNEEKVESLEEEIEKLNKENERLTHLCYPLTEPNEQIEVDDLYTHKDGNVYKVLDVEVVEKNIQIEINKMFRDKWFKLIKFTETLVWYTPTHNDSEIFVRTKSHFLSSFKKGTPIEQTPKDENETLPQM